MDRLPACDSQKGPDGKLKYNLEWPNFVKISSQTPKNPQNLLFVIQLPSFLPG